MRGLNPKWHPSDRVIEICSNMFEQWLKKHDIILKGTVSDSPEVLSYKIASRVNSWIGPRSVVQGVSDLVLPSLAKVEQQECVEDLGNMLGAKLMEEELLVASPKRGRLGT